MGGEEDGESELVKLQKRKQKKKKVNKGRWCCERQLRVSEPWKMKATHP